MKIDDMMQNMGGIHLTTDDVRANIDKRLAKRKITKTIQTVDGKDVQVEDTQAKQFVGAYVLGIVEAQHSIDVKRAELKKLGFSDKEINQLIADAQNDFVKTLSQ